MGKSMELGGGGRFEALKKKLGARAGVTNSGALAASIGRKKYSKEKFQHMAEAGKHRDHVSGVLKSKMSGGK